MKFSIIESRLKNKRCCKKVDSSGTGMWMEKPKQCCKHAKINIDGLLFCSMHAGQLALNEVIANHEN